MTRRQRNAASSSVRAAWAILAVFLLTPALGWGQPVQTTAQAPDRLVLYVALPAGHPEDPALVQAVTHEVGLAISWLEAQTGRTMRGDVSHAHALWLESTAEQLTGSTVSAVLRIIGEVQRHSRDPGVFALIVSPISTATPLSGPQTCARGSTKGLVMMLGNCPSRTPSTTADWGSPFSRTLAHELVHGLGAVQDCAPNATTSGHVRDDPADLMYEGPHPDRDGAIVLDAGRDDYWDHVNTGCADILDSPLWIGDGSE